MQRDDDNQPVVHGISHLYPSINQEYSYSVQDGVPAKAVYAEMRTRTNGRSAAGLCQRGSFRSSSVLPPPSGILSTLWSIVYCMPYMWMGEGIPKDSQYSFLPTNPASSRSILGNTPLNAGGVSVVQSPRLPSSWFSSPPMNTDPAPQLLSSHADQYGQSFRRAGAWVCVLAQLALSSAFRHERSRKSSIFYFDAGGLLAIWLPRREQHCGRILKRLCS